MAHRNINGRGDVLGAIGEAHDRGSTALVAGIACVEGQLQGFGTRPIAPEHRAEVGEERVVVRVLVGRSVGELVDAVGGDCRRLPTTVGTLAVRDPQARSTDLGSSR